MRWLRRHSRSAEQLLLPALQLCRVCLRALKSLDPELPHGVGLVDAPLPRAELVQEVFSSPPLHGPLLLGALLLLALLLLLLPRPTADVALTTRKGLVDWLRSRTRTEIGG